MRLREQIAIDTLRDRTITAFYETDLSYLGSVKKRTLMDVLRILANKSNTYERFSSELFEYLLYREDLSNVTIRDLLYTVMLRRLHNKIVFTDQLLYYLLSKNSSKINTQLIRLLLRIDNTDYLMIVLSCKHDYEDTMCYTIEFYSEHVDSIPDSILKKKVLLIVLDRDKEYITLEMLNECVYQMADYFNNTIQDYRTGDAINYCLYRIITKDKLSGISNLADVENEVVERLCINAVAYGAPYHLVELLLKFIPKSSPLHNSNYRHELIRSHHEWDTSLFEEDI